jgi:hypothetical protein
MYNFDFHASFDAEHSPAEYNYRDASGFVGEGHGVSVFRNDLRGTALSGEA